MSKLIFNAGISTALPQSADVAPLTNLDSLQDVTITGISDKELIQWDTVTSQWINVSPSSVIAGDIQLEELEDVTITTVAEGNLIAWDSGISKWINISTLDGGTY